MGGSTSKLEKIVAADGFSENLRIFGLENFGNTCYCNSVLQALFFCTPFRTQLLSWYEQHLLGADKELEDTLIARLGELFHLISQQKRRCGVLPPKRFVQALKQENEVFRGMMHQDAHEFWNFLLNDMIEHLNGSKLPKSSALHSVRTPVDPSPRPKTWIQETFEGTITSETKCLCCETVTSREESFLDLSLEISEHTSVTSCLRTFSSTETLGGRDKFFCNKCGSLQEAHKRIKVKCLPKTLALHLKRFKYMEAIQRFKKLSYRVVFPLELRLFNVIPDGENTDQTYELFAVVVHMGSGMMHGHYVCAVRIEERWFLFDDDVVELINESEIETFFGMSSDADAPSTTGYILFYQATSPS